MLKQIRYFQEVVRLGSFSKAAEECFISQSAISQQVKNLERELGVTLLKREKRSFSLTPAGEYFYRQSLVIMEDFDRLRRETVRIAGGDGFSLRVGRVKGYGGAEFQKAVAEFTAEYPDITVEMRSGSHEELYGLLRSDSVDIILSDQRRAFSDEYVNMVLAEMECHIEIAAGDPLAARVHISAGDLRRVPCILVAAGEQEDAERAYYREIYGFTGDFLFAADLEEARLMVVGGRGFLPVEGDGPPAQYEGTIACLPLFRNGRPVRRNYCAFRKRDNSGCYVEAFADMLRKQFER